MSTAVLETQDTTNTDQTVAGLLARPVSRDNSEPTWYTETRAAAWDVFESLPMPTRTDEAWRFANVSSLDISRFKAPQPVSDAAQADIVRRSQGLGENAGRMIFANDQLLSREIHGDGLRQKGVIWKPLAQAAAEHEELFKKHFMREEAILGGRKFASLHQARVSNGSFLYIPRGVEIDLPIEAYHWLQGDGSSCFPHTLIIAEEMSKVTFVDYFQSADDNAGFACGVNDLWLGAGAKVTYICAQNWSRQTLGVQINSTVVGRDASATALNLNLGGSYIRGESVSHLRGTGGRSDMLSVSVAEGKQEVDQRTLQIHEVPNTSSDLLYKNSLNDQARTIFAGLIRVAPGAHFTDAYQKVRNLLLSDEAEANSAPGLEIEADNVRCTHGATSGQVEEEELFYLESRGIPSKVAKQLIVFGFLNEVFERLPDEAIREKLRALTATKFQR
ncbi:Fe-S cluster assembly protein SufD [Verrucomicrobiota bacterium sgz303538]